MALDTQNKRRAAGSHFCLTVLPVADGTIDAGDRAQAAWLYRRAGEGSGGGGGAGEAVLTAAPFIMGPVG